MTNPEPLPPFSDSFEEMFQRIFGPQPAPPQSTGTKSGEGSPPQPDHAAPGPAPQRPAGLTAHRELPRRG